jgi:hypothetical protein
MEEFTKAEHLLEEYELPYKEKVRGGIGGMV